MSAFYFKINDISTGFKILSENQNELTTIIEQPYNPMSGELFKSKDEIKDFISGSLLDMFPEIKELNN
jgi:hypothetical protein